MRSPHPRSSGSPDDRTWVVAAPEDVFDDVVDVWGAALTSWLVGRVVRYQGHRFTPLTIRLVSGKNIGLVNSIGIIVTVRRVVSPSRPARNL